MNQDEKMNNDGKSTQIWKRGYEEMINDDVGLRFRKNIYKIFYHKLVYYFNKFSTFCRNVKLTI